MSHSYIYTRKFIEKEVKSLNKLIKITPHIEEIISNPNKFSNSDHKWKSDSSIILKEQFVKVLKHVNSKIKIYNSALFGNQVIDQIIDQILKIEQNRLMVVNEKLTKSKYILIPLLIPDVDNAESICGSNELRKIYELIHELPDSKYLFLNKQTSGTDDNIGYDIDNDLMENIKKNSKKIPKENTLIENEIDQHSKQFLEKEKKVLNNENKDLLESYDFLKKTLKDLESKLRYLYGKKNYLLNLKSNLLSVFIPSLNYKEKLFRELDEPYDSDEIQNNTNLDTNYDFKLESFLNTKFTDELKKMSS